MPEVAIIVLKPKKGKTEELIAFLERSFVIMKRLQLVSDRNHIIATARDGSILHIYEWANADSTKIAPEYEEIRELWAQAEKLCDFLKPAALKEFNEVFPSFTVIE